MTKAKSYKIYSNSSSKNSTSFLKIIKNKINEIKSNTTDNNKKYSLKNAENKIDEEINKIQQIENKKKIIDDKYINIKTVIQHNIERKRPVFTLPPSQKSSHRLDGLHPYLAKLLLQIICL